MSRRWCFTRKNLNLRNNFLFNSRLFWMKRKKIFCFVRIQGVLDQKESLTKSIWDREISVSKKLQSVFLLFFLFTSRSERKWKHLHSHTYIRERRENNPKKQNWILLSFFLSFFLSFWKLEQRIIQYHRMGEKLQIIPKQAKFAGGKDFSISINLHDSSSLSSVSELLASTIKVSFFWTKNSFLHFCFCFCFCFCFFSFLFAFCLLPFLLLLLRLPVTCWINLVWADGT